MGIDPRGRAEHKAAAWLLLSAIMLWPAIGRGQTMVDGSLGLRARNASGESVVLPLVSESLRVVIDGQHATTRIDQIYDNDIPRVIEGLFTFQGGKGAQVSAFAYYNGDQRIVGEVLEKHVAEQLYYNTVEQRRDPGLLETTGEGSFGFRVYPIQPNEKKRIQLTVEQWLPRRDRVVEYRIPVSKPQAEIEVVVEDERGVKNLRSTTHEIETTGHGKRVLVRVGRPRIDRLRELVLHYELGDRPFQLSTVLHRESDGDAYFVATVAAPHISSAVRQDLTLVIAGGLDDQDLAVAKSAARRIVERLQRGDRVNVIGHDARPLFEEPRWIGDETRARAFDYIDALQTSSKSPRQPLAEALERQRFDGRRRNVMLLTNGRRFDLAQARELLGLRGDIRVFALGIGARSDGALLGRLASLGGGDFVQIESALALGPAVDRLARQVAGPVLTKARLSARGAELSRVYPRDEAVLYQGRELRFVGRLHGEGHATLVLSGHAQEPVELRAAVKLAPEKRRRWVGRIWGRERVQHLLEEIALTGEKQELVEETTNLALAYDLVTPYTAFLAIPESELSWNDEMTLEEARRRKRALMSERPEVASLMSPAMAGEAASPESDGAAPPMDMQSAEIHGGGCAGCRIGEQPSSSKGAWLLLLGIAALWRRRGSSRRCSSHPAAPPWDRR